MKQFCNQKTAAEETRPPQAINQKSLVVHVRFRTRPNTKKPRKLKHEYDIAKKTCKSIQYPYAVFSYIIELYLVARSDSNIWLVKLPLIYHTCLKKQFSVNEFVTGYF